MLFLIIEEVNTRHSDKQCRKRTQKLSKVYSQLLNNRILTSPTLSTNSDFEIQELYEEAISTSSSYMREKIGCYARLYVGHIRDADVCSRHPCSSAPCYTTTHPAVPLSHCELVCGFARSRLPCALLLFAVITQIL